MEITVLEKGGGESCRFETRGSAGQCGAVRGEKWDSLQDEGSITTSMPELSQSEK